MYFKINFLIFFLMYILFLHLCMHQSNDNKLKGMSTIHHIYLTNKYMLLYTFIKKKLI